MKMLLMMLMIEMCVAIKVYDLSHPINKNTTKYRRLQNILNHSDFLHDTHWMHLFSQLGVANRRGMDEVFFSLETVGTHLTAPVNHNEANWKLHEIHANRLVAPLIVIKTNEEQGVQIQHLKFWERRHGPIPQGSVVVMDSGWSNRWNTNIESYLGIDSYNQKPNFPGFNKVACEYLIRKRVVGVGVDTIAVDGSEYFKEQPCLNLLANDDIYMLENLKNLDSVPNCGALIFVGALNVFNEAGSPSRILAVQLKHAQFACDCAHQNFTTFSTSLIMFMFLIQVWCLLRF